METASDALIDEEVAAPTIEPDDSVPASTANRFRSIRSGATGLRGADLAVLSALFFLPCAFLPVFQIAAWTTRMMLLLLVIPVGVVALVRLVRSGDTAARWAVAALASCVVSALVADSFLASFKGYVGQDWSVITFLGAFSLWALARFMSDDGRRLVTPTLLAAFGVNLFIGTIQIVARLENGTIALFAGRATGFTPNPVYFGALMAGGTVMCLHRLAAGSTRRLAWAGGAFAFSVGVAFSGSRVALLSMFVIAIYCVVRLDRVWAALGVVSAVLGTFAGSFMVRTFATGRDSVSRLAGPQGSDGRFETWRAASEAFAEKPVFGWGLGRFRYAVQGRLPVEDMAALDGANLFAAHNLVIGLAVAVGVPGLIFFGGFAWSTARRTPPEFGAVAAVIVMTWALQPMTLTTMPLVLALLGIRAGSDDNVSPDASPVGRFTMRAAVALGLVASLSLGVVDFALNRAVINEDGQTALSLSKLYMHDPVVSDIVAQSLFFQVTDDESRAEMFDAFERTTEFEPTRPYWWVQLARRQGVYGDHEAALESAERAIALEPFNRRAWQVVVLASRGIGDEPLEREAFDTLCKLEVEGACDAEVGAGEDSN